MPTNIIAAALALFDQEPPAQPPTPQAATRSRRRIQAVSGIVQTPRAGGDLSTIRADLARRLVDYIALDQPVHTLLVSIPPGGGKTFAAVRAAEQAALAGKRVLYAGPRKDFYADVLACAEHPDLWYQWQPRQLANEKTGACETCRYAPQISRWLARGYEAMDFCVQQCGWDYINDSCGYHAQKTVAAPIIFGQHAHVTLGHPLMEYFDLVIGDENPLGAILDHPWSQNNPPTKYGIPARFIAPTGMDITEPLTAILHQLSTLAASLEIHDGPALLDAIGGAAAILDACERFTVAIGDELIVPYLRQPDGVEDAPYGHLPTLLYWLRTEAGHVLAGREYEPRIVVACGRLHLLISHPVNPKLPDHVIWLDATANRYLYERMTGWSVESYAPHIELAGPVYQVYDSSNSKQSMTIKADEVADVQPKAYRARLHVDQIIKRYGYKAPLIASYLDVGSLFGGYDFVHFYGQRGTNRYEDCDAVIILGTPQPASSAIVKQARQLFPDHTGLFQSEWQEKHVLFAGADAQGNGHSYPASGFWADPDLQALLWQVREAEMIQSAHRVRPILSSKPIWILSNLPIDDLQPKQLMTIRELFHAPAGVDPYLWQTFLEIADMSYEDNETLTARYISDFLGLSNPHALRYLDLLLVAQPDRWEYAIGLAPKGRGNPPKTIRPLIQNSQ